MRKEILRTINTKTPFETWDLPQQEMDVPSGILGEVMVKSTQESFSFLFLNVSRPECDGMVGDRRFEEALDFVCSPTWFKSWKPALCETSDLAFIVALTTWQGVECNEQRHIPHDVLTAFPMARECSPGQKRLVLPSSVRDRERRLASKEKVKEAEA
ncbi:hypothetical protein PAAG_11725 [Paracoccidioides lutzii Pb01]|uniref:Uncharacterized protein n=1 Tax=Paracoccidioides lutzii (strain ATCC MYA-826 / Pb01) TaxID=502779 RepID=A0A0A2V5I2_PARBA|nr:hypothetical protein PAAG_11725 [Paracoccidioides lutzii Pb01]KGQ01597.1 hypothetical protein PAAG_11725 [Paracoccidioides lutzii Pb01]